MCFAFSFGFPLRWRPVRFTAGAGFHDAVGYARGIRVRVLLPGEFHSACFERRFAPDRIATESRPIRCDCQEKNAKSFRAY